MSFEYKILKFDDLNQPKSHDLDIYENVKKADPDEELTKKLNLLGKDGWESVSYTHLTLPTNREV